MSPATSVGIGTHWRVSVKLLLWLLGGGITALIVTFVLASISISGVQSMSAAMVALWIALGIFAFCLLVAGIRATENLDGGKAALVTLLLVGLFVVGLWARSELAGWLTQQKAIQTAAHQLLPPPAPKPPTGQILAPPAPPVGSGSKSHPGPQIVIRQGGKGNTANPGVNTAPIQQGDCGVVQNGGSNNTASPNCVPAARSITVDQKAAFGDCLAKHPGNVSISAVVDNPEAYALAQDWLDVFKKANWSITDGMIRVFTIVGGTWTGSQIHLHGSINADGKSATYDHMSAGGAMADCFIGKAIGGPTDGRVDLIPSPDVEVDHVAVLIGPRPLR